MYQTNNLNTLKGPSWTFREKSFKKEIKDGTSWKYVFIEHEAAPLKEVFLINPVNITFPKREFKKFLMVKSVDKNKLVSQFYQILKLYNSLGVQVYTASPKSLLKPNIIFLRDLFLSTEGGAIIARPASTARMGEEIIIQQLLSELKVPVRQLFYEKEFFECADALWIGQKLLLGIGNRTNMQAALRIKEFLNNLGKEVIFIEVSPNVQHLLGMINFVDKDFAIGIKGISDKAYEPLKRLKIHLELISPNDEIMQSKALNFVTLQPRKVLMPNFCYKTEKILKNLGVEVLTTNISEYVSATGGMGCFTGILKRTF